MAYCTIGDLAITVKAHNVENIGKIVLIRSCVGVMEWPQFTEPLLVWEVITQGSPLTYENPDGSKNHFMGGKVPDIFLRPIRPGEINSQMQTSTPLETTLVSNSLCQMKLL
jgi:hypothetical protein